jgi:hypothetical protein
MVQVRSEDMGSAIDLIDEGVRAANSRDSARRELDPTNVNELRQLMQVVASDEKLVDEKFTQASGYTLCMTVSPITSAAIWILQPPNTHCAALPHQGKNRRTVQLTQHA